MTKKIFLVITLVCSLLLFNSTVFAMDAIRDGMNNVGNQVQNSMDKLGNSVKETSNKMTNSASNVMGMETNNNNGNNNDNTTSQYTAQRTANEGTILGMNGTMWTWFVMAILGVVLVSLVWYYGMQKSNTDTNTTKHD